VLLSLSVHSAVRVGTERSHVKTHSAVWTAPECTHQPAEVPRLPPGEGYSRTSVQGRPFLSGCPKEVSRTPTHDRTRPFATAVRSPRRIDAARQTTALVNRGPASVAPRTTVHCQSEACNQTEDLPTSTARQASALGLRQPGSGTKSSVTKPRRSLSHSGTRTKLCDTINVLTVPLQYVRLQTDGTATPRAKHKGRLKRNILSRGQWAFGAPPVCSWALGELRMAHEECVSATPTSCRCLLRSAEGLRLHQAVRYPLNPTQPYCQ
jgi:hypothetical protein